MNYNETINYLFGQLPAFERQGAGGYKPGLQTSHDLDNLFGNPHRNYKTVHVAGTNGKGSTSSLLAATLQSAGYKVGLYTSPHIVDFTERIRVNGEPITPQAVMDFMARYFAAQYPGHPTFFELTSTMAFDYFARQQVDYAIIEVGLGGRLDSTNIITPMLSVITNISLDHTQFLGDTPALVAGEKAGIIKPGVPVVIGEASGEVHEVFQRRAAEAGSPITFAQDAPIVTASEQHEGHTLLHTATGDITCQLGGAVQALNANTALSAIGALRAMGVQIGDDAIALGFEHVAQLSGLIGRWQVLQQSPRVIADSGHNTGAFTRIVQQLRTERFERLHMVLGMMADKSIDAVLALLPRDATYYFTAAHTSRALPAEQLQAQATGHGLHGQCYGTATEAYEAAKNAAQAHDLVYVGGSMYVLAEVMSQQSS